MKKTLVAIAALAAFGAQAQSSVTIDGVMDAGYQAIDYKGNKVTGFGGNGSATSQINFRGTSDLGGGLKADFRVETDWNTVSNSANTGAKTTPTTGADGTLANGASFGNGEIRTGLAGDFGKVQFGAINNNTLIANLTGQPFGTAIGSGHGSTLRSVASGAVVRSDNSFQYISPKFSGFDVAYLQANKQTKQVAGTTGTGNKSTSFSTALGAYDMNGTKEVSVSYANGPLAARFTNLAEDSTQVGEATGTKFKTNTLGVNYALGAAKVFLWNQTIKADDNSQNSAGTTVSATYTMGSTVLMAQTGSVKNKVSTVNKTSNITSVGADYNLSKTTALFGRYESIKDSGSLITSLSGFTAAPIDNATRTRLGLGIRTAF